MLPYVIVELKAILGFKEIILLINQGEHLYCKQLKTRDTEDISAYRKIRNSITYKIRITKKEYYNHNIFENKSKLNYGAH